MLGRIVAGMHDMWLSRRRGSMQAASLAALPANAETKPVVVVTGGSDGIGLALARRFAAAGDNIMLIGRDPQRLAAAAKDIETHFRLTALPLALDLAAPDAIDRLDAALAAQGLHCDVLVLSAGIGLSGAFHAQAPADIDRLVALNVSATTKLMRHFLPGMRARGRGGLLTLASLGGATPGPYQAAYYASKAYVMSLSEAIAAEVAGEGVRVTVVAPGPVQTKFHARMGAENGLYLKLMPVIGPEAVARAAFRGFRLGRHVVAPGIANTVLLPLMRALPHTLLTPIVGVLLKPRGTNARDGVKRST